MKKGRFPGTTVQEKKAGWGVRLMAPRPSIGAAGQWLQCHAGSLLSRCGGVRCGGVRRECYDCADPPLPPYIFRYRGVEEKGHEDARHGGEHDEAADGLGAQ